MVDAANPRTAKRHLPAGLVSPGAVVAFTIANAALFVVCAWLLNPLCFALSPVALLLVLGYSHVKRFSALCHIFLGLAIGVSPVAAGIAASGQVLSSCVFLSLALWGWIAGFDIVYSTQDSGFDRERGPALHSRRPWAIVARCSSPPLLHVLVPVALVFAGIPGGMGPPVVERRRGRRGPACPHASEARLERPRPPELVLPHERHRERAGAAGNGVGGPGPALTVRRLRASGASRRSMTEPVSECRRRRPTAAVPAGIASLASFATKTCSDPRSDPSVERSSQRHTPPSRPTTSRLAPRDRTCAEGEGRRGVARTVRDTCSDSFMKSTTYDPSDSGARVLPSCETVDVRPNVAVSSFTRNGTARGIRLCGDVHAMVHPAPLAVARAVSRTLDARQ